jgi:hypothetical protein
MTIVTGFLIDNGPQITLVTAEVTKVNTALAETNTALASTSFQMQSLALGMAGLAVTTTAVALKINSSVRGPAVGVKSTDANFNYNVNANVLTARNALAGPTDQIPIPPPPVGL